MAAEYSLHSLQGLNKTANDTPRGSRGGTMGGASVAMTHRKRSELLSLTVAHHLSTNSSCIVYAVLGQLLWFFHQGLFFFVYDRPCSSRCSI